MLKILILGYTESNYIKDFIQYVLNGSHIDITLTDNHNGLSEDYAFYKRHNVRLIRTPLITPIIGKIPKIKVLWYWLRHSIDIRKNAPYDIILIQFVTREKFYFIRPSMRRNTRLVVSFWGSDIYRKTRKERLKLRKYLDRCSMITLAGSRMLDTFHDTFGSVYDRKIRTPLFGVHIFQAIDDVLARETKEECKQFFGIKQDTTCICIGYNACNAQQHAAVLKKMKELSSGTLDNTTIILPMAYGEQSDSYKAELMALLEELPCPYIVLRQYLSQQDVARLRIATDIYINAQTTDAFSASVQEYLYAGAVLLNPVWIQYYELVKLGVPFIEYKDFADLRNRLEALLTDGIPDYHQAGKKLKALTSWEAVRDDWLECFGIKQAND